MQIYRFHDLAAMNPPAGLGETFYLTEREAREMRLALGKVIRSIQREGFSASTVGTFHIDATGSRYRGDGAGS